MKRAMGASRRAGWERLWLVGCLGAACVAAAQPAPAGPARASEQAEGRVIDRVVAIIEGQVLTQSELEFEGRVALIQRGGYQAAEAALDEETLKGALELVITQRLQVLGAERLQAFPVERADVEARVAAFRASFPFEGAFRAFLARHDADLEQLTGVLERSLRAERILDGRIRLRAQVGEAEVRRYYEQHTADFPGGYEAARAAVRKKLERERYSALAAAELAQVRATAQVRRVAPFAREARR
ncbi:hypothetical protein P2318_14540 [Myxococcaceae bacterium GXIMD 01537]